MMLLTQQSRATGLAGFSMVCVNAHPHAYEQSKDREFSVVISINEFLAQVCKNLHPHFSQAADLFNRWLRGSVANCRVFQIKIQLSISGIFPHKLESRNVTRRLLDILYTGV